MTVVDCVIPGKPVGKGRPRFGRGRTYTPATTVAAEEALAWTVKQAHPNLRVDADSRFEVSLRFHVKAPKRPDIDNALKLVLDALNGVVWADDWQVQAVEAQMVRNAAEQRTELTVWRVNEEAA